MVVDPENPLVMTVLASEDGACHHSFLPFLFSPEAHAHPLGQQADDHSCDQLIAAFKVCTLIPSLFPSPEWCARRADFLQPRRWRSTLSATPDLSTAGTECRHCPLEP
eukprot:1191457-Prorocentrum_minimum.AAC.2